MKEEDGGGLSSAPVAASTPGADSRPLREGPKEGLPLEQYRALVESCPLMLWRSGTDGKRDYFNGTWLRFTGNALERELDDGWLERVHTEDVDRCIQACADHSRKREEFEMEYRLRRKDGAYRHIVDRGAPFYESERFQGWIGSCEDVQERREAEQARDSFIRMIGHELRTPLQSLLMFVEAMRRQALGGVPASPESFSKVKLQVDRLSRLVSDFQDVSRMSQLPLSLEPLDLETLVEEVIEARLEALKATPLAPRHSIVFETEDRPFPVVGDRVRLEQVFTNLIDNAIKYSPRGGVVEVAMRSRNGWHSVSISDPGIGIPEEDLPAVGRRFFRARNVPPNNFPGLGVGLALAREIVEQLRGAVRVESQLERGTRVTVTLPAWETEGP